MKKRALTLIFVLTALKVFAQYHSDSLQPDSIYKANKVHSRTGVHPGSPSKSKDIFIFDDEGRTTAFILTDNETGNSPQLVTRYTYNQKGVLLSQTDSLFDKDKYAVEVSELSYSSDGTLTRQVVKNNGNRISEKRYPTGENKIVEKLYRGDTVYREQTSIYDVHGIQVRFAGKELADLNAKPKIIEYNGKSYTFNPSKTDMVWDYTFVNTYDKSGNLIVQERYENGKLTARTKFKLDRRGLLSSLNDDVYSYTFY
jgi:YD repeat-containing protein